MSQVHIPVSVVYREGRPTAADYQEAIEELQAAAQQLEPDGMNCRVCHSSEHQAWECHHNPLVMARRAAREREIFRCFHCGFTPETQEQAIEHYGNKRDALPACMTNKAKLIALMKAAITLAIVRHDLTSDGDERTDAELVAEDTVNAVRGIDTCDESPLPEWEAFFVEEK